MPTVFHSASAGIRSPTDRVSLVACLVVKPSGFRMSPTPAAIAATSSMDLPHNSFDSSAQRRTRPAYLPNTTSVRRTFFSYAAAWFAACHVNSAAFLIARPMPTAAAAAAVAASAPFFMAPPNAIIDDWPLPISRSMPDILSPARFAEYPICSRSSSSFDTAPEVVLTCLYARSNCVVSLRMSRSASGPVASSRSFSCASSLATCLVARVSSLVRSSLAVSLTCISSAAIRRLLLHLPNRSHRSGQTDLVHVAVGVQNSHRIHTEHTGHERGLLNLRPTLRWPYVGSSSSATSTLAPIPEARINSSYT